MFFNFCGERMVMEYLSCQLEKHDKKLEEGLPNAIWQELCDFLDPQPEASDVKFRAMRVIHELATRAVCKRTSIEEELKFVIDSKSIDPIFPSVIKQRIIKEMTRLQQ